MHREKHIHRWTDSKGGRETNADTEGEGKTKTEEKGRKDDHKRKKRIDNKQYMFLGGGKTILIVK